MHCPRCGTSSTPGQQFCRACGLGLDKVAELLGLELSNESATASDRAHLRERQQKFEHWAGIAGLFTFALVLLLFIVIVFSQIVTQGGLLSLLGIVLILLALGAAAMAGFQGYSKSLKARLNEKSLPRSGMPPSIGTDDIAPIAPASVSEATTELLSSGSTPETRQLNGRTTT
jgi:hypothetical protein